MKRTWIPCTNINEIEKYQPITQVYCVCFNSQGEILLIDEGTKAGWKIMGGKLEAGESIEQGLRRELMEEANIEMGDLYPIGVQEVNDPQNSDPKRRKYYQARFCGIITKMLDRAPDPDNSRIHPRQFFEAKTITEIVKWGETGEAMFSQAIARVDFGNK